MHQTSKLGLRPGVGPRSTGAPLQFKRPLGGRTAYVAKAPVSAPAPPAKLSEEQLQLLQQYEGPLVKIATHYHVGFGDCLKVVGSCDEFGAWDATHAPLMKWGEGDVWSLVVPLPPGDHEFKVVVQQASGNLVWEAGDLNRIVSVPEDAPVGSMLTSVCAFNIIDGSVETKVKPVTADVMELLEASLEEAKVQEEAKAAAAEEAAAVEAEKGRVAGAAAAVAKALATMDAEAEEKGIRPRTYDSDSDEPFIPPPSPRWPAAAAEAAPVAAAPAAAAPVAADTTAETPASSVPSPSDSDENAGGMRKKASRWAALKDSEDAGESSGPSRSRAGPAVVAATAAVAEAPVQQQQEEEEEVAAAALKYEMALKQSEGEQVVAEAALEMGETQEVSDELLSSTPSNAQSTAASVHAKLTQGKPVAVGFVDKSGPSAGTSSVVAAFMKSVGGKAPAAAAAAAAPAPAAAVAAPAAATAAVAAPAAAATTAAAPAAVAAPAAPSAAEPEVKTVAAAVAPAETAVQQGAQPSTDAVRAAAPAAPAAAPAAPAAASGAASSGSEQLPKGWGPSAVASKYPAKANAVSSSSSSLSAASPASSGTSSGSDTPSSARAAFSSSMVSTAAGTPPNSPKKSQRPPSPGRGSSHVVSAAAAAVVAAEWIENVRKNDVVSAARDAEKAASELAARLQQARLKKSEAAAEADMLNESLKHSSMVKGVAVNSSSNGVAAAAGGVGKTMGFMSMGRSKVRDITTDATAAAGSTNPLAPPPITPVGGAPAFAAASSALASSAAAAGAGPSPPPVTHIPTGLQRVGGNTVSTQAVSATSSSSGGAGALTAASGFSTAPGQLSEAPEGPMGDGVGGDAMQMLAAVVGCAAVGTVLWSEFVLKDTGCGLPPGPFGLMGAAEGLSYLTVLGFAGAGVGARVKSGGKQGLQGPLVVPETLAYGALAAGLLVLASQLNQYGYIPPPLPGGQCFADAVALPGVEALNHQFAALQAIFAEGMDKLHLQQQIAILQAQVEHFSGYVSAQAEVLDLQMQVSLLELQTGLDSATLAVSSFVDSQIQQIDMSGKLSHVLDILRTQEQQLKVELPQQLAELQQLAATSMAVVHETALQASGSAHLPELLSSLDQVMSMLHGVLETRINQLDVVLTQLQGSIGAAAGQLSAAVAAAEQSGSKEAAAQMQGLQLSLNDAMADVQSQVWAGYQQLALADKLSDMLLTVRTSAATVASSTASEVDKLRLREQLQELEGMAESSAAALAANAVDSIQQLHLDERFSSIATQASAAAASLQAGMKMQYEQTLPAVQSQVANLQASLSGLAAKTEQGQGLRGPELSSMLRELQHSMDSTMKLVGEVATSGVTAAGDAVQGAGKAATSSLAAVNEQLGAATGSVSASLVTGLQGAGDAVQGASKVAASGLGEAVQGAGKVAASGIAAVTDQLDSVTATAVTATQSVGASLSSSAPQVSVSSAAVDMAAPLVAAVRDITPAAATAAADATTAAMHAASPAAKEFVVDPSVVAAAYAEAVEAGLDWNTLVAYALPDQKDIDVLQALPTPEIFNANGVRFNSLTDASDTIKSIWFNRPQ